MSEIIGMRSNLANCFHDHQSFQSDLGFEGTSISFAFSFAHGFALFSSSAEPEKSYLRPGPNYGVHFSQNLEASGLARNYEQFESQILTFLQQQRAA